MTSLRHVVWVNELAAPTGGCEAYVLNTAKHLAARGVRSTLLYDPNRPTHPDFLAGFDAAFPLVEPASQVRALAPDLVYVHRLTGAAPMAALLAGGAPVVRFFHDHRLFCLREHKYTAVGHQTCAKALGLSCWSCLGFARRTEAWPGVGIASLSSLRRELDANRGVAGVVVGSTYMAEHVALHGFDASRVHVVPLYAEGPTEAPGRERERDLVVFLGQLVRGKGVDVLLDAAAQLRSQARVAILGTGRQEAELRRQAAALGLSERVSFLGHADAATRATYLARATVVAVPSRAPETFGLVGLEAMSHGAPVVASRVGGMGEWLEEGRTGLGVPSNDPRGLAAALDRVLGDPPLAARLGTAGRSAWEARFQPQHHVEPLLGLLGGHARRREAA